MQAVVNASAQEHEFVKEFLINESKYPVLIQDLIATELWRDKVFLTMIEIEYEPKVTFPLYMVVSLVKLCSYNYDYFIELLLSFNE